MNLSATKNGRAGWVSRWFRYLAAGLFLASLCVGVYTLSVTHYLLFHTGVELFCVSVAVAIFMLVWNARNFLNNNFLLFIGLVYFCSAGLDLLHALAFKGMGVFPGADANLPTQLWIAARGLQAGGLLAAPLFLWRPMRLMPMASGLVTCAVVMLLAIFHVQLGLSAWPSFPVCYVEGSGLTSFKITAEYLFCGMLVAAFFHLFASRSKLHPRVFRLVGISILMTAGSELAFTQYVGVYGHANLVGHLLKGVAFYLVYRAIVKTGINRPYDLLFLDLRRSEERFRSLFDQMGEGFALHEILTDEEGRPCDYRFLDLNPAYERLTGLQRANLLGKRVMEVLPTTESHWIENFGKVALTGESQQIENFSVALDRWFDVFAYRPATGQFAVIVRDITARKQVEMALRDSRRAALTLMTEAVAAQEKTEKIALELQQREEQLRIFVEHAPAAIAMLDTDLHYLATSRRWLENFGLPGKAVLGQHDCDMVSEIPERWRDSHQRCLAGAVERGEDDPFDRADGTRQWLRWEMHPWNAAPGTIGGIVIFSEDVTAHKKAELRIERLTKLYAVLSRVNEVIVRTHDENSLLEQVCRIVAEDGGLPLVWIGFLNNREIEPVAWAGAASDDLKGIQGAIEGSLGLGPAGTAAREGHAVVIDEFDPDASAQSGLERTRRLGIRAAAAFPLRRQGIPVGALTLYASMSGVFDKEQVHLLNALAADLSYALDAQRMERLRAEDELTLRAAHERAQWLARFPSENPSPILRASLDGTVLYRNSAAAERIEWGGMGDNRYLPVSLRDLVERAIAQRQGLTQEVEMGGRIYAVDVALFPEARYVNLYGHDITEQKQAEAHEREALALASASRTAVDILNAMGEGVMLVNMKGRISSVNPAMEKMLGRPAKKLIGRSLRQRIFKALLPEDQALASQALDQMLKGQATHLPPLTVLGSSGARVPVIPSLTYVRDPHNQPTEMVVTLRDISELRAMHQLLEESNALLERIFDNTHLSIVYLDKRFNFVRVNRAYAEACGHEPAFFVGKNHFRLYPHAENEAIFRRVVETGESVVINEKPFAFPDHPEWGVTYWDWTLRPLRGEKNKVESLLFCLLDVTQRVRARQKLVQSEQKYRELVENANSLILRITPEYTITFFNEYAQKYFGYSEDEVLGKNVIGTIVPEIDSEGRPMLEILRSITDHMDLLAATENENICKNGRRVWVHWANRAIRDSAGEMIEILCVGTDISKRREMEAEARHYQKRLSRLAERLAASEEEDRWRISRYIHDTIIQNLSLSSIKLGTMRNSLTAAGLDEDLTKLNVTRKLIGDAVAECRSVISDLTPSLLYDLGLIPALKDFTERLQAQHNLLIQVDGDEGTECPLNTDLRGLLFQSTRELVMNAVKHAGGTGIHIVVDRCAHEISIRVQDDGKGFNSTALNRHAGAAGGFGLFSVRERLEGLGGRLDIDSTPGQGTTARIQMPI